MPHESNNYSIWIVTLLLTLISLVMTINAQQSTPGLVVEEVAAESAAAKAGIKIGDRLLTYDGKELISPAAFLSLQENTFGKKEVGLSLRRKDETLILNVSSGVLGIKARPDLSTAASKLYEEARTAVLAKKSDEAVAKLKDAAQVSAAAGEQSMGAWLRGRAGEQYEAQRRWKEAIAEYEAMLDLLKESKDQTTRSRTMLALGRCKQSANEFVDANLWFEQARQVDLAAGNEMWVAGDLNSLGNLARARGELEAARDHHSRALAIRERLAPNSLDVAASLNNLGLLASDRGELDVAQDYHDRALAIRERLAPNSLDVATSLNNLANVAYERGNIKAARDYLSRSLTIRERLAPESLDVSRSLNNLGLIARSQGDFQAAEDYLRRALVIKERLAPNSLDVSTTLTNLGLIARNQAKLQAAQDYYHRALAIRERLAPNSLDVALGLNNLGLVASDRGDLQLAQAYHSRALAIQERLAPNLLAVAITLNDLGIVAARLGEFQSAKDHYGRSLTIKERLAPNSLTVAATLSNLGSLARDLGDLQGAQAYYSRALAIQERLAPNSLDVAKGLGNLGLVAIERADLQFGQDYLSRALVIFERLVPNSLDVADSLISLGIIAYKRGMLDVAKDYYTRALAIRERLAPNSLGVAESLNNLGDVAFKERRFADSRSHFARAVNIVEVQRSKILSSEARALLLARYAAPFSGLLRTHLELNDLPAAFAISERARARSLVEMLAERRLDLRSDAPAELIKEQDELDQKRSAAYSALARLDAGKESKQIGELQTVLEKYDLQQRELAAQIRRASPKLANLQYPEPLDLDRTQAALDSGTLLLSYYVDEPQTYLFAVTKGSIKLFRLPITERDLNKQIKEFQNQVSVQRLGNSAEEAQKQGSKLYETLVGPAKDMVKPAKRVLVCPDGPLHTLPFAALVSRTKAKPRYFIEDKPLHSIVSMTVYAETRPSAAQASKHGRRVLAFGDPIYSKEQTESAKGANVAQVNQEAVGDKKEQNQSDGETDYLQKRGLKLDARLPHTRKEVEEIARLFGNSATIKLDKEATETSVRRESKDYSVVHFAVHGWLDEQIGLNSGLVLSRPELLGKQATKDDNGLLQAWEILEHVQLDADLVVLSACESGLGQRLRGEGLIGLTRAIQYSGARSIVVSLWGVNDESTAAFMQSFYGELKRGASKDVALQKAMAVVRSNAKWSHPFYWSPFILAGSWN